MEQNIYTTEILEKYFLAGIGDEKLLLDIEARIEESEDFAENMQAVEENLIEKYLDNELDDPQKQSFEKFYLASDKNRRKLREIKVLREIAAEEVLVEEESEGENSP